MTTFLTVDERQKALATLTNLYDVSESATTRRTLVENAGLHRFVGGLSFSTNQRTFAGQLINVTESFGPLPEKPNTHALGALLNYVIDLGELPTESAASLAGLVVKYALVADDDFLQTLRQKYNITVDATPAPDVPASVSLKNLDAEPSPNFAAPEADEEALERVINSQDNFLDIYLLAGAMYSAQAVGRIERPEGTALGTGFLIGPSLLLTNQHVLTKQEQLEDAVIRFGYRIDASKVAEGGRVFRFDPAFYHSSPAEDLDFALVRLMEEPLADVKLEVQPNEGLPPFTELLRLGRHRGYLPLGAREITKGARVNIIQHPRGLPQKVVLTLNYVVNDMSATRVHYLADTEPGSSGSPVFNSNWEVVALHHSGNPVPPLQLSERMALQLQGKTLVNEGIPMRAIIKEIESRKLERFLPR